MKEKLSKAFSVLLSILLWAVILLAALYTFTTLATKNQNHVASLLGYTPLSVKTESMKPTFDAGDLIIIKQCDPSTLEVGDIITFHTIIDNKYALNTHRITNIEEYDNARTYTTKGDNNPIEDVHIIQDGDIVGKYQFRIKNLGKVMDFLSSSLGFLLVIVLPMLIFFIYQVYNLIMIANKVKKAEALEAAEEAAKIQAQAQTQSSNDDETARLKAELEEAKRRLAEAEAKKED